MKQVIIVDMDGTTANIDARLKLATDNAPKGKRMNWDIFLNPQTMLDLDTKNDAVVMVLKALYDSGKTVIVTSARNERHRDVTTQQLNNWGLSFIDKLYLRADGDFRPDEIVKQELLQKIKSDGLEPVLAIDDRTKVVNMWRSLGIPCFQVRDGDF